jgi:LPXTG-motif cell wall-anchored protein
MLKKIVAAAGAALAASLVLPAGAAMAHDHAVHADCYGLSVDMWDYSDDPGNTNTVDIWIDGAAIVSGQTFGATYSFFQQFDGSTDFSYRVKAVSTMFPDEASFDTGVQTVQCANAAPTTTSTTSTTSTTTTTTTTVAPAAPTTPAPPTTAVSGGGAVATTTTTVAPVSPPTPPTPPAAASQSPGASPAGGVAASGGALPSTGSDEGLAALIALGSVLAGAALIRLATRRHPKVPGRPV